MKILYCITRAQWGGAQSHIFDLICEQDIRKNETILVIGEEGELTNRLRNNKISCKIIILPSLVRSISPMKDLKTIISLRKIIKDEWPDIVHLHSSKAGSVGRISCMFLPNIKVIFTVHGWAFTEGVSTHKAKMYIVIERLLSGLANRIICVSKFDYKIALRENIFRSKNGVVVYNGVPEKVENTENFGIEEMINFVMVARFSENQKRQDLLIEAANVLVQRGIDNFMVTFIGDGEKLVSSQKLTKKYNLSNNIKFLGFQENPTELLDNNSVLTLVSDYEGLPISIIEGMSMGCPILATDVGGVNELVVDGINGFLTSRNVKDIAEAMNRYLNLSVDNLNEFSQSSKLKYSEEFTKEKFIQNTFKIYNEV